MEKKELSRTALAEWVKVIAYTDWAKESSVLCRKHVYEDGAIRGVKGEEKDAPKSAPELPEGYEQRAQKLAASQAVLAGYRLADKLNVIASATK